MHRPRRDFVALFLITVLLGAGIAGADETGPVQISPERLAPAPAGTGGELLELTGPAPGPAERWRQDLAAATERRDQDIAALQAELSLATGANRVRVERRLQTRKLDFEIEVLELQLALAAERPDDTAPGEDAARTAALARLEASLEAARTLRDGVATDEEAR